MSDVVRVLQGVTHMYTGMCIHSNSPFQVRIRIHIRDKNSHSHLLCSDSYSYSEWEFENERRTLDPRDAGGVDGRGVRGWDGRVCGLGAVGASSIFGLVRAAGAFVEVIPTCVFGFKNPVRATIPWFWSLPQCRVFFVT
jgi:hypothetical protein